MIYLVKAEENRHFVLYQETATVGQMNYSGVFQVAVNITIGTDEYKLGPSDFWVTSYQIVKSNQVYVEMSLSWGGLQVIKMASGTYTFHTNVWNNKYALMNEQEQTIAVMEPDYNWSTFAFNYEIETNDDYPDANNPLLIMAMVYCCNYRRRKIATDPV